MNLPTGNGTGLQAQYFNSATLDPRAAGLNRIDPRIDFRWGYGSPDSSISTTNFSTRWIGQVQSESSGKYTFYTNADDGVRLWVNGKQLIDNWTDHAETENQGSIDLIGGQKYSIQMEYYQHAGRATAQLSWSSDSGIAKEIVPQSQLYSDFDGLTGQYYNSADLNPSTLALTRKDATIDFNWGSNSPDPKINADNFSIRETGKLNVPAAGQYTISTYSDDGVRLWLDGNPIINQWNDHGVQKDSATLNLSAGQHDFKVEYYEHAGSAQLNLTWQGNGFAEQIIPAAAFTSAGIVPTPTPSPALIAPTPTPTPAPFPTPTPTPSGSILDPAYSDSIANSPNDAHPDGVPSKYSWYNSAAQPGWMNNPRTDWSAITGWGQVYAAEGWHPEQASNTRVQLRNDELWILSKSTGRWTQVQAPGIEGGAFNSDFGGNGGTGVTTKDESSNGGGLSVTAGNGFNYHFWPGARATMNPNDIGGIYTKFEARLVLDNPFGEDDRAQSRYIASAGADYWRSKDAPWAADWSNNGGVNGGRFKFVKNDWQNFAMTTLLIDEIMRNPPPIID